MRADIKIPGPQPFQEQHHPQFIKYMGSKSKIMDFVLEGINYVYQGGAICDLFAGSASLAGALDDQCAVHSNDIQHYSSVLANVYSNAFVSPKSPTSDEIISKVEAIVKKNQRSLGLNIDYTKVTSLKGFNELEETQKKLLNRTFRRDWHLFVKNYSGTWWSADQCIWIDAIREVAEGYKSDSIYHAILAALMFSMAYCSQGTGHYAQYRDAKTKSSMSDILIYRKRSLRSYFDRKLRETLKWLRKSPPVHKHTVTSMDYVKCLTQFEGGTVYADPPYCFVHYSRFYHALETVYLYDYPNLQVKGGKVVKGRYRENRHQSPFCIQSQVKEAFTKLFEGVRDSNSNLALSYSNTGMISIEEVQELATTVFTDRKIELLLTDHKHMTLGRLGDRHREVKECLLLVY